MEDHDESSSLPTVAFSKTAAASSSFYSALGSDVKGSQRLIKNIPYCIEVRTKMHLRGLHWIGTPRARGREEDQRRPGGGQLWKRHREKE
jgi:hypothetical protein